MQWYAVPAFCTDRERLPEQRVETHHGSLPKTTLLRLCFICYAHMQEHMCTHVCVCLGICIQELITAFRNIMNDEETMTKLFGENV